MTKLEEIRAKSLARVRLLVELGAPAPILEQAKARLRRADEAAGAERLRRLLFGGKA